jgi:hypothetical protein
MSLLSRLQSKFGRFAVPNVTVILIFGQVLLYAASYLNAANGINISERIKFFPGQFLAGEYWRVFTFLFEPPSSSLIFAFFFWYLFYMFGTTLEVSWGTFRYNVFLLVGYIASVGTALAIHFIMGGLDAPVSNAFLYGTVFLAFARLYPDFVLQILFILPVKVKWLALIQWIGYGVGFLFSPSWMVRAMIAASVANYLLFFGRDLWQEVRHGHRRMQFQARVARSQGRVVHKCRTCGVTSDDNPQMQFRYCSKCADDSCYCTEHLRSHEHIVEPESAARK